MRTRRQRRYRAIGNRLTRHELTHAEIRLKPRIGYGIKGILSARLDVDEQREPVIYLVELCGSFRPRAFMNFGQ